MMNIKSRTEALRVRSRTRRCRWIGLLAVGLCGAAVLPAGADDFTWSGTCGTSNWFSTCTGGACDEDVFFRLNNWGRQACGEAPPVPGDGDNATIDDAFVVLPNRTLNSLAIGETATVEWGDVTITVTDVVTNDGTIDLASATSDPQRIAGTLENFGTINSPVSMNVFDGTVENTGEVICTGGGFSRGGAARGSVSVVENGGTIRGFGTINTQLINAGEIRADGGTLTIASPRVTSNGGFFEAEAGATLRFLADELSGTFFGGPSGDVQILGDCETFTPVTFNMQGTGIQWMEDIRISTPAGTSVTNASTGTMSIVERGPFFPAELDGTVVNQGDLISNTNVNMLGAASTLENEGDWHLQKGNWDVVEGINLIDNTGTIDKTTPDPATIDVPIENLTGEIRVEEGLLRIQDPILSSGLARYNVLADGELDFGFATLTGAFTGQVQGFVGARNDWTVSDQDAELAFDTEPGFVWADRLTVTPPGILTNAAGGFLTIDLAVSPQWFSGEVLNAGTLVQASGVVQFVDATLVNGNTVDFQSSQWVGLSGTNLVRNDGVLRKTTPGTAIIDVPFVNAGTVIVEEGDLLLRDEVTGATGGLRGGDVPQFDAAVGARLRLFGGPLSGTVGGAPAGFVGPGGSIDIGATGSTLDFSGTGFQWEVGTIDIPGGATLTNAATGTFRVTGTASRTLIGTLVNDGTLVDSSGGSTAFRDASLRNHGVVELGGAVWSESFGTNLFENTGELRKSTGSSAGISLPIVNSGTFDVREGILFFQASYDQTAGVTQLTGGELRTIDPLTISGGVVRGTGTIQGPVDNVGGSVEPGLSAGRLVVTTDPYTQGPDGLLVIEIGGPTPETEFDVLDNPSQTAVLDGTLEIQRLDGYEPNAGAMFVFMTYGGHDGEFAEVRLPAGWSADVVYGATELTLEITGVQKVGDIDKDGDVDLTDGARFAACLSGPGNDTPPPGCDPGDFIEADTDGDEDVDLADYETVTRHFTG